jgi:hypothetical protein
MAHIRQMPPIIIGPEDLSQFVKEWTKNGGSFSKAQSMQFGKIFDSKVGEALAFMLGGIPIIKPGGNDLVPKQANCVEVGDCRIVGGVRPQNFDVGYRPDGVRFAFDSKTLNDTKSVEKNWQNMINDLGTEATTVHIRFPYAVVAFLVAIPKPCLTSPQKEALAETLERMTQRASPIDAPHKAKAIALVIWDPVSKIIDKTWPSSSSYLRIECFSEQVQKSYFDRYKGLPPHDK